MIYLLAAAVQFGQHIERQKNALQGQLELLVMGKGIVNCVSSCCVKGYASRCKSGSRARLFFYCESSRSVFRT